MELKLVFGAKSSPGIYDLVSDVFLVLVLREASFPRTLVAKHLDDILAVGRDDPADPVLRCQPSISARACSDSSVTTGLAECASFGPKFGVDHRLGVAAWGKGSFVSRWRRQKIDLCK